MKFRLTNDNMMLLLSCLCTTVVGYFSNNRLCQSGPLARLLITGGGGAFPSDFGPFSGSENLSFQWLLRGNFDFYNNND